MLVTDRGLVFLLRRDEWLGYRLSGRREGGSESRVSLLDSGNSSALELTPVVFECRVFGTNLSFGIRLEMSAFMPHPSE